ncbi:DUF1080 domain-containing protein [Maribellus comscasis]|uniref:DUF1080 domain-containing protein n=1 Tax=Maribellus comscasis TaxID=2681766 RepID=A0A6I6JSG8_9BACT|nr:DUF1080 domain-containing protein [Maribellus comscasis]QGY43077.1 DUF1080 domain-containing protein [Maribellus comscasis]
MQKLFILLFLFVSSISKSQNTGIASKEDWINLFNGTDLTGWEIKIAGIPTDQNYKKTFVAEDSMIRIRYDNYEEFEDYFGHMYFKKPFSYYKLSFDYRFVGEQLKGGASWNVRNSGIMLHSQSAESNDYGQDFPVSIELQLLGGLNQGERTTANVCTPGTAVEMGDTVNFNHCINSASKTYNGDQWVHVEAVVLGGEQMTFIVEGDTVLNFQKPQITKGFINAGIDNDWENFGITESKNNWLAREGEILTEGYIALQAESHPIDFKNIKLLNLCGCMDKKAKNYKSYYIKNKPEKCEY